MTLEDEVTLEAEVTLGGEADSEDAFALHAAVGRATTVRLGRIELRNLEVLP